MFNKFYSSESGNIFFALFGAVIIVGLLGTVVVSTMRGPLSTMVNVQTRTKAESEMDIASRLVLLEATQLPSDGDCDADGYVEPLEYLDAGGAGPTGGGFLPNVIASSRIDPWGIQYGYCAWDAGGTTNAIACDTDSSGTNDRLDGNGNPTDETYTVIAIISAGQDQVFQTVCNGGGSPSMAKGGDDIVVEFTYGTAIAATNGLWNIKSGDPSTAEIGKNLEVTGGASFTAGIDLTSSTAALQLGAASMLFPSETTLVTCNGANGGLIRIDTSSDPDVLQICDAVNGWVPVSSGFWSAGAGNDIYYNSGTPQVGIGTTTPAEALDVAGNIALTGNLVAGGNLSSVDLSATGNAAIGGTLGVTGATTLTTLNSTGAVDFDTTLNVDGASTLAGTLNVTGSSVFVNTIDAQGTISSSTGDLNIGDNLIVTGTSDLQGAVSSSTGDLTLNDAVDITGAIDAQNSISSSTGNLSLSDNVDITGDLAVSGDITGTNITASATLNAGTTVNVNGDQLGPALNCAAAQKLVWTNGAGWSCDTDLQGGSGGGSPDLEDVLTTGNDAATLSAVNLGGVGIGTATPSAELHIDEGDLLVTGTYTGTSAVPVTGAGTRMFFHPAMGAFRAGTINGTQWDDANLGAYSIALGNNTQASGFNSIAMGSGAVSAGNFGISIGYNTLTHGGGSIAMGLATAAQTDSNIGSMAFGNDVYAYGDASIAMGTSVQVGDSAQKGNGFPVEDRPGDLSMAIGLGNIAAPLPRVTGNNSLGIFMGNQAGGLELANDRTMLLAGGSMVIDPSVPATNLSADTALEIEGTIKIADGGEACVAGIAGAIRYNGGNLSYCNGTTWQLITSSGTAVTQIDDLSDAFTDYITDFNMALGSGAGTSASPGRYNIALGQNSLNSLDPTCSTAGNCDDNTAIGYNSLTSNTTGYGNTGLGPFTLAATTTGNRLTALGARTLENNTTGELNTALGYRSLSANTTGSWNTATGNGSMFVNTTGSYNTAYGYRPLFNNSSGDENVSIGSQTLYNSSVSDGNVAIGANAMQYYASVNTGNTDNVAVGRNTFQGVSGATTGERNTAIGALAGDSITTGSDNILIGYSTDTPTATTNEYLNIGGILLGDIGTTSTDPKIGAYKYCDENLANCFVSSDVSGGNSDIFEVTGVAGSEVVSSIDANVPYTTADFVFGSPQLADDGDANHDNRMFFDKSKGAFRSGYSSDARWDDANVGFNSIAMGYNVRASGVRDVALGSSTTASGGRALATGANTTASGYVSTAMGGETLAIGDRSFAIGLGSTAGAFPQVSAANSFGIFMGDQGGVDLATANTMGLFGGKMVVDPAVPATNLVADTALEVEGSIKIADGGEACAAGVAGAMRYNTNTIDFCDGTSWTTLNSGTAGGLWTDNTTHITRENMHILDAGETMTSAGFDGGVGRGLIWYPDKSALRVGNATGTEWDEANVGTDSVAFINGAQASGVQSFAVGNSTVASGADSIAMGLSADAAGFASVAIGRSAQILGGQLNVAIGTTAWTDGDNSFVFGEGAYVGFTADNGIAIGHRAGVRGTGSYSYGKDLYATATNSLIFGSGFDSGNPYIHSTNDSIAMIMMSGAGDTTPEFSIQDGIIGINNATPATALDIAGTVKIADGGEACAAGVAGAMRYNTNTIDFCDGTSWTTLDAAGGATALSDITAATATNTIANANFAQVWNWDTLTTETAMALASTSITSGGLLDVFSSTTDLTGNLAVFSLSGSNAANTGNVLKTAVNGTLSNATPLMVTNLGVGNSFRVNDETGDTDTTPFIIDDAGNVGIGTTTPQGKFEISSTGAAHAYITADTDDLTETDTARIYFSQDGDTVRGILGFESTGGASVTDSRDNALALGTGTSNHLQFFTLGSVRTTILNTGEFGIATNAPATALDVSGTLKIADGGEACAASVAGAMRYNTNTIDFCDGTSWTTLDAAGGATALSSLTAATATNTIANTNFAQVWNWDTLTTETAMALASTSITSGGLLDVFSSTTGLTGNLAVFSLSGSNAANTGNVLKTAVNGTLSAATPLMVTNLGVGNSFRVNDETGDADSSPFVIDDAGNVGIGTATPAAELDVSGTGSIIVPRGTEAQRPTAVDGMIRYKTDTGTSSIGFEVREAGAWVAMGAAVSDKRLKENIKPLSGKEILDRLAKINTYSYTMKNDKTGRKQYGVIAQELSDTFPELVDGTPDDSDNMMSVRYISLIAPMIEATKELKAENDMLKNNIKALKTAQNETKIMLKNINEQITLLNRAAGNNVGKASMQPFLLLLLGLMAGMGIVIIIPRKKL